MPEIFYNDRGMVEMAKQVALGLLLAAVLLAAGCSPAGGTSERVVFTDAGGSGQGLRGARPVDVIDVGLPLHNLTGQSVRLRSVTLVSPPKALHVRSVTAYTLAALHGELGIGRGDLLRYCRTIDPPHPVTDVVTPPHADSDWVVVIAFTIVRPGRYNLGRAKISYTTGGQDGWQYQNLSTTIFVNAAPAGARPRFDGC